MADIKVNDLNEDMQMTEAELNHVRGGIGLLLPAVQQAREAASLNTSSQKVLMGDGSVKFSGDGSV